MHEESDSALIARAKEDPEAFGILYERYVDRIYEYIYYRTSNRQDAEDLTARTFYRALKHLPHYVDRGAPFSAYLHRIAHNLVANWHRDHCGRQVVSFDESATITLRHQDTAIVTEEQADKKHKQDMVLQVIRQLSADRQQLLILKFVERMSNAEIARVMGRTEGAVKSLYHRTLIELRGELARVSVSSNHKENKQWTENA
jgi:RNA polymerase sigma-70 factor (ECF subfamily)